MTNAELISMVRSIAKHGADWRINEVLNRAADALKAQQTVDAVQVVRCRECKWFDGKECCDKNGLFVGFNYETFFCADGERRSDGEG